MRLPGATPSRAWTGVPLDLLAALVHHRRSVTAFTDRRGSLKTSLGFLIQMREGGGVCHVIHRVFYNLQSLGPSAVSRPDPVWGLEVA